jgi:hypothetical protein
MIIIMYTGHYSKEVHRAVDSLTVSRHVMKEKHRVKLRIGAPALKPK